MGMFQKLGQWVTASPLYNPLRVLYGGSFSVFLRRMGRLRNMAGAMVAAAPCPPLPVRVQVEITDVCNISCRMCAREVLGEMDNGAMPMALFTRLMDETDPYYVTLNGLGEPMLDKSVHEKLHMMHHRDIMTAMPSNGSYLTQGRERELAREMPSILTFSIDGATAASYEAIRIKANFDKNIGHYKQFARLYSAGETRPGSELRVLCVLQKENLFDYQAMFALLREMQLLKRFSLVLKNSRSWRSGERFQSVGVTRRRSPILQNGIVSYPGITPMWMPRGGSIHAAIWSIPIR